MEHTLPLLVMFVPSGMDGCVSTLVLPDKLSQINSFLTQSTCDMAFSIKL